MSYPGAPGYGAPPQGAPGYGGAPPGAPGYGAPPPQGAPGYGAPPPQGAPGYGGAPPGAPGYGAAPPQGAPGYGAPPGAPGYSAPPQQYGGQPGYGAPPSTTAPPPHGHHHGAPAPGAGAPPSSTGYGQPGGLDPQIVAWFQAVDHDRSGHIDEHELSRALANTGTTFSIECAKLMIKMFDKDHSGKIGVQEFQALHNYIIQMRQGFDHVDRDRSGKLSAQEVQTAIQTSGYQLTPQTFDSVMKKFDRHKTGGLGFDGYVELCCFLGTARNVFAAFDTQRNGQVVFGFDQFIYATNMLHS